MTIRRDHLGRFAPCCEHGDSSRNERGQCRRCQREAKDRYEVAHYIARQQANDRRRYANREAIIARNVATIEAMPG